jgi:prepilin peptidase CpaA
VNWLAGVVLVVVAVAAVIDFRTHRIPNLLTFPALALALVLQFSFNGLPGVAAGLLGMLVGVGLFLLPFLLGGMGAGDVKLMGVAGAFLGPEGALWAVLFSGLAGGVLAIFWGLLQGRLGRVFSRTASLMVAAVDSRRREAQGGLPTLEQGKGWTIPYGVAIAFGVALSIWWRAT